MGKVARFRPTAGLLLILGGVCFSTVVRADSAADALLQKCVDTMTHVSALQANFESISRSDGDPTTLHGSMRLKKPNFARIILSGASAEENLSIYSDGKRITTFRRDDNQYLYDPVDLSGGNISRDSPEISIFFYPDLLNRYAFMASGTKIVGKEVIGGVPCKLVQILGKKPSFTIKIGPDGVFRGLRIVGRRNDKPWTYDSRLSDVKPNAGLTLANFEFSVPKNAKPYAGPVFSQSSGKMEQPQLLPVGSIAPDFTLPDARGGTIAFSSLYRANKVTLLNFWGFFCGPCRAELPHLNEMLGALKGHGFDIVTVNSGDSAQVITKLWRESGFTMHAAMNGDKVSDAYRIIGIPTNYLVTRDGKIIATFLGYDPDGLAGALAKYGLKVP